MSRFESGMEFSFETKTEAKEFCKRLQSMEHNVGFITVNDVLRVRKEPLIVNGGNWGYNKDTVRRLKPKEGQNARKWTVALPPPGKMVRDDNGYWKAAAHEGG